MKKIILFLSLPLLLTNCGQPSALVGKNVSPSVTPTDCSNDSCFTAKAVKVEGVISQRQLLPNYLKCLNLSAASATTVAAVNESIPSLSQEGAVADISAPLLMAVTKVAGEVCNDLINKEKTNLTARTFFPGYKLGTTNSQTYSFSTTLKSFATACWGRAATDEEVAVIVSSYATPTQDTVEALYACTAMLSASQAIKF
jgi:hypothetical protein